MVKVRRFLREELKCQALLTDMNNAGPAVVALQDARAEYDYVDDHFYVDHPTFLERPWRLPSGLPNNNPIREGAVGASPRSTVRLFGKPFTVSEYQYAGPGRFRGVGGILTGAMGALQDWDILWRFAYSHKSNTSFEATAIDYFNMDRDPLSQASDRAALLLFLRRDIRTAPNRVAVILPLDVLRKPKAPLSVAGTEWLAWITREGSVIVDREDQAPSGVVPIPLKVAGDRVAVASLLRERKFDVGSEKGPIRSETGEIAIDKRSGVLVIDTPRSAGGYADPHERIDAPNAGVKIDAVTLGATVFVSSLDANPIRRSRRLLVTHLTDLQNTGIRYAESARQTLLDWGGMPHLVNNGSATVHLALAEPGAYAVWGLATSGRRVDKVESQVQGGELVFTARVRGSEGATLYYEVIKR